MANSRRAAIYILWKGGFDSIESAVPGLKALLKHEEEFTRGMAAIALGANHVVSSYDAIASMTLEDKSGYARRCAAYALGLMGEAKARPVLEKALKDSDPLVKANAQSALQMLGNPAESRPSGEHSNVPRLPAEVMNYIVAEHLQALGQALQQGLYVNSHVYAVDEAFNLYWGGLLGYRNDTDQPQSGRISLGTMSLMQGFVLLDESGREQRFEFEENSGSGGPYRLYWRPEHAVEPGVSRLLGYVQRPMPLARTDGRASLTMQNHFGAPVLENFFLVTPRGMKIIEPSEASKSSTSIGDYDIHLWQKNVPAGANHVVTATLEAGPAATQRATDGPVADKHKVVKQLPAEVMNYITAEHRKTYGQATQKGLPANCHIYEVDKDLNSRQGGLLVYRNDTGESQSGPIPLGSFSSMGSTLVDEEGREQRCKFEENTGPGGRYLLYWYPDPPLKPGTSRILRYGNAGLFLPLPRTDGRANLTMQNHPGAPVLENFFLVVPKGTKILKPSEPSTSSRTIGDCDVYLWQKKVPAETNHLVTASLQAAPAPVVVETVPSQLANDVDPTLDHMSVTFDQPMFRHGWAWIQYDSSIYPPTKGTPSFDDSGRTCTVQTELKPGHVYMVGFNSPPKYQSFRNEKEQYSTPYVLLFATRAADGKPTPLPADLVAQVKRFNAVPGSPMPHYNRRD